MTGDFPLKWVRELMLAMTEKKLIPISEIFGPVIQGEGSLAGTPTVFVRVGGCDYRCSWCDTMYAVDKKEYGHTWTKMSCDEIFHEVQNLSKNVPLLVTLSGGNPALFALGPLIDAGHRLGYTFACETQGSVSQPWFCNLSHLILSPKPPSSGESTNWDKLLECIAASQILNPPTKVSLKIVVSNYADYEYAKKVKEIIDQRLLSETNRWWPIPFYILVCSEIVGTTPYLRAKIAEKYDEILSWIKKDQWYDCHLGFQQHTMIYGNKRGV